jgi:hypothetical protein
MQIFYMRNNNIYNNKIYNILFILYTARNNCLEHQN